MIPASAYLSAVNGHRFSREQERRFFRLIKTSNGTMKTTTTNRLDPMNELFFAAVERLGGPPKVAMDVGVSSGITTLEWLDAFERRQIPVTMIATDHVMSVELYAISPHLRALVERNGHLLQIEVFGHGIRTYLRGLDYLTGAALWRPALCRFARRRLKDAVHEGEFQLVAPALRRHARIRLADDDIFAPNPAPFIRSADVVRIGNLLQPIYFSDDQIRRAAANIGERCRGEGSFVIVCRNTDTALEGSILRMNGARRFDVAARLGKGSEVESYFTAGS
jgi:hypothetical protein